MKKLFALFGLLILIGNLASCSNDETERAEDATQQTLMVFMPWSGSNSTQGLYPFLLQNIDSIEAGIIAKKGLGRNRVMVFLSTSATRSTCYEITYNNGKCTHTPLKEYTGKEVYTTKEGIQSIVSDMAQHAPALNYAMIIGCHGTGWTQKSIWEDYPTRAKRRNARGKPATNYMQTRFYGSVDDIPNYATDISTLADALTATGIKMQYILFDDCYMANAETAYELRHATNFLVASTSEVLIIGMPYRTMWSNLSSATPNYTTLVSQFNTFYKSYDIPCGALSVIDCRQMDAVAEVMKQVNAAHTFDTSLQDSLQVLDGFNTAIFYDMDSYVAHLTGKNALYDRFKTVLSKAVRASAATEQLYSYLYNAPIYIDVKSFSGITISDPTQSPTALKGLGKTAWWKATH